MTEVFRAPMRARALELPAGAGAEHGLEHGLVGTGDKLDPPPRTLAAAVEAAERTYGPKAARMLERFAALPDGTFVWTRDTAGLLWLGRIAGPWRYDPDAEAGIHHVRPTEWLDHPLPPDEAPAAVVATFDRGGRNLQRIAGVERRTAALWAEHDRA